MRFVRFQSGERVVSINPEAVAWVLPAPNNPEATNICFLGGEGDEYWQVNEPFQEVIRKLALADEAEAERRKYELLRAAAVLCGNDWRDANAAVTEARKLLAEVERQEAGS